MWDVSLAETRSKTRISRIVSLQPDITNPIREDIVLIEIDLQVSEAIVSWPLEHPGAKRRRSSVLQRGVAYSSILNTWLFRVLPFYSYFPGSKILLEFWMKNTFYPYDIISPNPLDEILQRIQTQIIHPGDQPDFILLNYNNLILEIIFADDAPSHCSCVLPKVMLRDFIPLFRDHHFSRNVRSETEISLKVFTDGSKVAGALAALSPLTVID